MNIDLSQFIKIDHTKHKKGHGNSISIKVVIPSYCQAHCPFCFNKMTSLTQKHDFETFFENLDKSLSLIVNNINRELTLDITGNEPTFDIKVFKQFMEVISKYKKYFSKIVLTSNGYHLNECIPYMKDIVDIVNISVHHYNYFDRCNIFETYRIPKDSELYDIIKSLNKMNISITAVTVLYKKYKNNFKIFFDNFTFWAKSIGFTNVRMRSNFCNDDEFMEDILNTHIEYENMNSVAGLTTKIIIDKRNNFETRILKGVPDLMEYVIGVELVIDDNGKLYVDYNKKYPVDSENINIFNDIYVKDKYKNNL